MCATMHNPTFHPSQRIISSVFGSLLVALVHLSPALSICHLIYLINSNSFYVPLPTCPIVFLIVWEIKQNGCVFVLLTL